MDAWSRIRAGLRRQPPALTASSPGGRLGAALALLGDAGDGDLQLIYTRRRGDLANHPGQISFPGGRAEPGESVEQAAVREAAEEVGLDPATAAVIGRLPALYIPPSRFWLHVVVARWERPHPLVPAEAEVAEILRVRTSTLCDPDSWWAVRLPVLGWSWAWQLDSEHLLWGATALVTAALLDMLEPSWRRGTQAADLAGQREARPWERDAQTAPHPGPPRLPGVPEVPVDAIVRELGPPEGAPAPGAPSPAAVQAAARAVAGAVEGLLEASSGRRVLVLAGRGATGMVGLVAAAALRRRGRDVSVILHGPPSAATPWAATPSAATPSAATPWAADLDGAVTTFQGVLPSADVVVDGLVGTGLRGPLAGTALALVHALRFQAAPVLSIDLPSGLDPHHGLIGEAVPADVTVVLGQPSKGLFFPGLWPFVGDVYIADLRDGSLARLVPARSGIPQ